ncbi:TetR/AcrR family transcriptional regulator [Larkinella rosea]|uniref:TetR/AcrR family transcriptional regulator n=1 Tax=Larkinella rosea TaxID=2025312 RepID=A0A3P1BUK4_9BACT|nr:TetR/AcrR family transcriptional regulator [Larkinella rosea]RRB04788.1 TetR/AcrR family transcriptional regulator [Larkinella rosea]
MDKFDKPERILATALQLFVEYGFHGTPTSKIASEAGVSNGTLFHYFKTKDELVVSLYTSLKSELNQYLALKINEKDSIKEKFRSLFTYSVAWALENRDAFYFLQQFHFSPHLELVPAGVIQQQSELSMNLLQEAQSAKVLKPLPLELIASLFVQQINGLYQYLTTHTEPVEKQQKWINDVFELSWTLIANSEAQ